PDGTFLDPLPGTGSGFDGDVNILLPQPDRKVVALGDFGAYAGRGSLYGLARLGEDGSLDVQFAKRASKPLSENGRYDCAAFLSGWRLALGGFFTSYGGHAANGLLRLSPEGGMDKPFLDKAMDLREISAEGAGLRVRSVAPARGGRLLIAGDFDHRPAVLMLEPDGTNQRHFQAPPDSTYFESVENRGSILTATLPDGSILLAGSYRQKEGGVVGRVVRLLPGGTRDRRFSAPDFVGGDRSFQAMVVQRDGSVVLGGSFSQVDDFAAPNLARLGPDGTPDRAFARKLGDGFGRDAARRVRALLLLKDGSILAAGAFGVGRLLPDGRVDAAFAENQAFGFDGPVQALAHGADGAGWVGGAFTGLVDPKSPVIPWNRCAAASDCRAVRRPCGDWDAVNRLYAADVAAYNEKRRGSENCVYIEYPRGILACERKACVLNPAP
ncbi:MAG TPA: delta-60 repeat domain-containing protein, partial [Elusimicrobiota bacterium]|nr:delta-60 repeat domain-containing protein [Elusimicrobiota bacterium]